MASQQRIALVVGNADYKPPGRLRNPANDAALLTQILLGQGYTIVGGASTDDYPTGRNEGLNPPRMKFLKLVSEFLEKVEVGATAIIYYAGHALQVYDKNYLIPIDVDFGDPVGKFGMVEVRPLIDKAAEKANRSGAVVAFLDACRNNPLNAEEMSAILGHFAPPSQGEGQTAPVAVTRGGLSTVKLANDVRQARVFVGFATAPGELALDGPKDERNSPFAKALARHLATRGLEIKQLYNRVQADVLDAVEAIGGHQDPWSETNLSRELYVNPRSGWPIVWLAIAGLFAGLVICLSVFDRNGIVNTSNKPWVWAAGLVFGIVPLIGTFYWGSGRRPLPLILAWLGPGFGFSLALATLKIVPEVNASGLQFRAAADLEIASNVYYAVTLVGGLLYLLSIAASWMQSAPPWPRTLLQLLNRVLTWLLPVFIVVVLMQLNTYLPRMNPLITALAFLTVISGILYAASVALSLRLQGGVFRATGPVTGAMSVGLLMVAMFAVYAAISVHRGLSQEESIPLLIGLGALWHTLLGAQIGYCFVYYVPDHTSRGR